METMNSANVNRVLHLAETVTDVANACRLVRSSQNGSNGAHWILTSTAPDPATPLPAGAEWIRLPPGGTSVWRHAFGGLIDALSPDAINVYPGFATAATDHLEWLHDQPVRDRLHFVSSNRLEATPKGASGDDKLKIGYVLKRFPRYSETFILREVLALEAIGHSVQTFSIRPPREGRFHASLARLNHTTVYLSEKSASKLLPTLLPSLPSGSEDRERFAALFWECVDRSDPALLPYLLTAVDLAGRVREAGITHLHAHFGTSACEITRFAAAIAGVGYSFTVHAKDIYSDDVDRVGLDLKFRDCRFAVTVCDANDAYLREAHPVCRDKLVRIYNGLDLSRRMTARFDSRPVPHVLAIGRFVEKKGFGLLLDALDLLARQGVPFTAEIIGDGELFESVRARRDALGLTDRVALPGVASSEQIQEAMAHATLLACPCIVAANGDKDALPTVLLEALAAGLPTISTDVGGIREILADGRAGRIVEQTPDAIAAEIRALLGSDADRQMLAERGLAQARAEFDIHRNVRRLAACFAAGAPAEAPETTVTA